MPAGEVEDEESDYTSRLGWFRGWQSMFFGLNCVVMSISLVLYLCLLRAVASSVVGSRKERNPIYLFLLLHFCLSLVEDGLIVHQFVLVHHSTIHTESLCRYALVVLTLKSQELNIIVSR